MITNRAYAVNGGPRTRLNTTRGWVKILKHLVLVYDNMP